MSRKVGLAIFFFSACTLINIEPNTRLRNDKEAFSGYFSNASGLKVVKMALKQGGIITDVTLEKAT